MFSVIYAITLIHLYYLLCFKGDKVLSSILYHEGTLQKLPEIEYLGTIDCALVSNFG